MLHLVVGAEMNLGRGGQCLHQQKRPCSSTSSRQRDVRVEAMSRVEARHLVGAQVVVLSPAVSLTLMCQAAPTASSGLSAQGVAADGVKVQREPGCRPSQWGNGVVQGRH